MLGKLPSSPAAQDRLHPPPALNLALVPLSPKEAQQSPAPLCPGTLFPFPKLAVMRQAVCPGFLILDMPQTNSMKCFIMFCCQVFRGAGPR